MRLCNIFPIKNQRFYKDEKYVMILAHLLNLYSPQYFHKDQFVILDNGLYENAQVSTDLRDLIKTAQESSIHINEIVIPDKFFDSKETIRLFEKNKETIKEYSDIYSFMFVAQSNNLEEFEEVINYINQYKGTLNLVVGIPKKAPYKRESDEAIEIYKKCKFPIHFLGLADNSPLKDLIKVENIIRSCDTSQIATMIKNTSKNEDVLSYVRKPEDVPIDLLEDYVDEERLEKALTVEFDNSVLKNFLGIIKD